MVTPVSPDLKRVAASLTLPAYILRVADDIADATGASRSEVIARQLMQAWPRNVDTITALAAIDPVPAKRRPGRTRRPQPEVTHEPMFIPVRPGASLGFPGCLCSWRSPSERPVSRAMALRNASMHVRRQSS